MIINKWPHPISFLVDGEPNPTPPEPEPEEELTEDDDSNQNEYYEFRDDTRSNEESTSTVKYIIYGCILFIILLATGCIIKGMLSRGKK